VVGADVVQKAGGRVVLVQPIAAGMARQVNEQDGLYTVILRGRVADDERRRFYRLTTLGRRVLETEADRLARVVALARAKNVIRRPELA